MWQALFRGLPVDAIHGGSGETVVRGTWIYATPVLGLYDRLVPGLLKPQVWQCPSSRLVEQYRRNCGPVHVDLGPGTGFYLERQMSEREFSRLVLVDARESCLRHAGRRLQAAKPERVRLDMTCQQPPLRIPVESADSVAASFLIHCLPRGLADAGALAGEAARLIGQRGVFFGSTLLPQPAASRLVSRSCTSLFNRIGIFGNRDDSRRGLVSLLESRFARVQIEMAGCVALFRADNRPRTGRSAVDHTEAASR